MRTWFHLALWGAFGLAACSSGGPNSIIQVDTNREDPGSFGNREDPHDGLTSFGSGNSSRTPSPSPTSTGTFDSGTPPTGQDSGGSRPDTSTGTDTGAPTATCEDLQGCCDQLSADGGLQSSCTGIVEQGDDQNCASVLNSLKQSGQCE